MGKEAVKAAIDKYKAMGGGCPAPPAPGGGGATPAAKGAVGFVFGPDHRARTSRRGKVAACRCLLLLALGDSEAAIGRTIPANLFVRERSAECRLRRVESTLVQERSFWEPCRGT